MPRDDLHLTTLAGHLPGQCGLGLGASGLIVRHDVFDGSDDGSFEPSAKVDAASLYLTSIIKVYFPAPDRMPADCRGYSGTHYQLCWVCFRRLK